MKKAGNMEYTQEEYDKAINEKRDLESKQESCSSQNGNIEEAIERLEIAYSRLYEVKGEVKDIKEYIARKADDIQNDYRGNKQDKKKDSIIHLEIDSSIKKYLNDLDSVIDEINLKIQSLKEEKASNEGLLAQIGAQLEKVCTWLENCFN